MKKTPRLVCVAIAIATTSFAASAQLAYTAVDNGLSSTNYGPAGQVVTPVPSGASPSLTSLVGSVGVTDVSTMTLQTGAASLGVFDLGQSNGIRAVYQGAGTTNTTSIGSFDSTGLTSGFRNDGVLGTNAIVGDTAVQGDLSVSGTTSTNGINNNGQRITNVAAGVASSDASTVGQLNAATAAQAVINANQAAFNANQSAFNTQIQAQTDANRRLASTGTAIVAAAASIPALEAGKQFGMGMGVGTYDGRSALSVGLGARVSQALQLRAHIGTGSGGKVAAGAGGMWSW